MIETKPNLTTPAWIAPCGLDCRLCRAYTRDKKPCPGCRARGPNKSQSCWTCKIKNCAHLAGGEIEFCFDCGEFPCALLLHLDKRYRTRYGTSPIANLRRIQGSGLAGFIEFEDQAWACPECGARLSMHKPACPACGWRNPGLGA